MAALARKEDTSIRSEETLYHELDKGIADMEQGRTVPHEEAMQIIRERLNTYEL